MAKPQWVIALWRASRSVAVAALPFLALLPAGCGPTARIPPRPAAVPGALPDTHPDARMTRGLAPVLYLQRDESFQIARIVAVIHPTRPVIGYHLLWVDDVHGAWLPRTRPTDEEVVWVGYDSTGAPTDVWTYWHGTIVHADWRGRGTVLIDVQWGKHGSLPRNTRYVDLPLMQQINLFWLASWIGLPDIWLGHTSRPGPWCFCRGPSRYRQFTRPLWTGPHVDVVVRLEDPRPALTAVFGENYSNKAWWPWLVR